MRLNHGTGRRFMLSVLLLVSFTLSYGQNITLNLRNTTVSRAVTEIQKMYGYSVVVKSDGLDMERVVSVSLSGEDVKGALTKIFAGQPVDVEVNGRNVSIMKQVPQSPHKDSAVDIKGIIKDEFGEPLIGASVLIKGKQGEGTITDFDGAYNLRALPSDVLVISFIGYKTIEMTVADKTVINASLLPDTEFLEATVVVGYGTQKKVNLSGAVSAVNLEETGEMRAVTNLSSSLQGVAAGMLATHNFGHITLVLSHRTTLDRQVQVRCRARERSTRSVTLGEFAQGVDGGIESLLVLHLFAQCGLLLCR